MVCPSTLICCESILWRTIFWRVRAICFASAPSVGSIAAGALGIPANKEARARPKTGSNLPCSLYSSRCDTWNTYIISCADGLQVKVGFNCRLNARIKRPKRSYVKVHCENLGLCIFLRQANGENSFLKFALECVLIVMERFLMTCCVMVLAPPSRLKTARRVLCTLIPAFVQNVLSSVAVIASCITLGISDTVTGVRLPLAL